MKKNLLLSMAAIALISGSLWLSSCQKDNTTTTLDDTNLATDDRTNGDSKVFPKGAHPYGKSYKEWTVIWMLEFVNYDLANNPFLNPANALFFESGPVYMLAGLITPGASVDITVPHGKSILFPLVNVIADWPCPPEFGFEPAPGQSMEDFLQQSAIGWLTDANVTNVSVTIDGSEVSDPERYLFTSDLFEFAGNPDLNPGFDVCITGEDQPGVSHGYYIMLKPLAKGTHTVHYHIEMPGWGETVMQDGTFNITVL